MPKIKFQPRHWHGEIRDPEEIRSMIAQLTALYQEIEVLCDQALTDIPNSNRGSCVECPIELRENGDVAFSTYDSWDGHGGFSAPLEYFVDPGAYVAKLKAEDEAKRRAVAEAGTAKKRENDLEELARLKELYPDA